MAQPTDRTQTMVPACQTSPTLQRPECIALEDAAARADRQTFALLVRALDWSALCPADLTRAIDLALSLDLVPLARELVQQGSRVFPDDTRLQQMTAVLAPPVAIETRPAQGLSLDASQTWLKEHAAQYKGQWIAVQEGTLLGAAPTLKDLYVQIGEQLVGCITLALLPQPCQAHRRPQFPGPGLLTAGDGEGLLEAGFRLDVLLYT